MLLGTKIPVANQLMNVEPLLLIDDSPVARKIMRNLLLELGVKDIYEIERVSDLPSVRQRKLNFIICDIEMAPINGIQFAAALKQDPELNKVPILLVTGSRNIDHARYARRLNISGMLLKPFSSQKLHQAIKITLSGIRK